MLKKRIYSSTLLFISAVTLNLSLTSTSIAVTKLAQNTTTTTSSSSSSLNNDLNVGIKNNAMQLATTNRPLIIRVSHVNENETPKGMAAIKFKELVEIRSEGRVNVQVYPKSSLFIDKEEMEALELGAVDILIPSMTKMKPTGLNEFSIFDMPFLFSSNEKLYRVLDGDIGKKLIKSAEKKNIKLLAYWDNGFKNFSADRPIESPKDFKNLKFRIQNSSILENQMTYLGANPVKLAFSDVVPALMNKTINGTENPNSNFYSEKMYLYQPYMLITNHGYLGYLVIANNRWWKTVPDDIKSIIEVSLKETTSYERKLANEENVKTLNLIKQNKTKVIEVTPENLVLFKNAIKPLYEKELAGENRDLLLDIMNEVSK